MVSVKNEINELLLNCVSDLENRLEESRTVLSDIQEKMDSKVNEAKGYKLQVDDAKENIKRLESEIESLENDLTELKDKYSKKNLVALIDAGTKEINSEVKKKQDEIQIYKNKIAELTNRARSIKDLLMNLKKDKKLKEEKLKELEKCVNYYKNRLENVVRFAEEHDDLDDYFVSINLESDEESSSIFEDIVEEDSEVTTLKKEPLKEVTIEEAEEVFNDVISNDDEKIPEEEIKDNNAFEIETDEIEVENEIINEKIEENLDIEEKVEFNDLVESEEVEEGEKLLEETTELKITDLLDAIKEPMSLEKEEEKQEIGIEKIDVINKTIDNEFLNVFGQDINEPIKTIDFFGNEYHEDKKLEEEIVNKLTNIGLDYYSFIENDRVIIRNTFNESIINEIVNILKTNKIQLDNVYVDGKILSSIAPRELENIINKLLSVGQSPEAIGYILDKLPMIDSKLLDETINNYGDYIKNVDIVDIIFKSLKGDY